MRLSIPWGPDDRLEFEVPPAWELLAEAGPAPARAARPLGDELRRALESPHKSEPLRERDLAGKRVALVVEDATRPAPTAEMLDVLMGQLFRAGVRSSDVKLLPGLGVHRRMSAEEVFAKYGESAGMVEVVQPDAARAGDYRALGELAPGIPCELHRDVCEADLVVLVGTVEPHIQAGFGGGAKMLVPGAASARCIAAAHVLGSPRRLVRLAGRGPEHNPMRRALDAAAGLVPGEVMIFNVVLNAELEVVRAFAGDPLEAHRAAARLAASIYGVELPGEADVAISGSRPMDRDWRQGVKCFGGPLFAVRPGGVLVAAMRCLEGLGDYRPPFSRPLPRWLVRVAARLPGARALLGLLARRGRGLDPEN
ncbi:MAG: lactate racemase domain-containing protein, partial [Planctomycetota bacterium]